MSNFLVSICSHVTTAVDSFLRYLHIVTSQELTVDGSCNLAAHARGYVDHGPMGPDDGVFVAAVRVVVWHSKLQRNTTHYNTGQYITA